MLEGLVIEAAFDDAVEEPALHAMGWPELVAKIAAAQDLRAVVADASARNEASFGAGAAQCFAALGKGKPNINHEALSAGSSGACKVDPAAPTATDGDREA